MKSGKTFDCGGNQITGTGHISMAGRAISFWGNPVNRITDSAVQNCKLANFNIGIYLYYADRITAKDCTMEDMAGHEGSNGYGITLDETGNNIITDNEITQVVSNGIHLFNTWNNSITKNRISSARFGIVLDFDPTNNLFEDNEVTGCMHALHLDDTPGFSNTFMNNIFCGSSSADIYNYGDFDPSNIGIGNTCSTTHTSYGVSTWEDSDALPGQPCRYTCP